MLTGECQPAKKYSFAKLNLQWWLHFLFSLSLPRNGVPLIWLSFSHPCIENSLLLTNSLAHLVCALLIVKK